MTEQELVAALEEAKSRDEVITILRKAEWTFTSIAQALETTKNAAIGAFHRAKHRAAIRA